MKKGRLMGKILGIAPVFVVLVLTLLLIPMISAPPALAQSEPITLYTDYTLTSDMTFSETGFIVAADNIVLDLNSHTIAGSLNGFGINLVGHTGVTIKNGTVTGFIHGVHLSGSDNNIIKGIVATNNYFNGISLFSDSDNNLVQSCTTMDNGSFGIIMNPWSDSNTIENCTSVNNEIGVIIGSPEPDWPSTSNTIENNIVRNNQWGIVVMNSGGNFLIGNTITEHLVATNSCGIAVVYAADNNIVKDNSIDNNYNGIAVGDGVNNTVQGNTVTNSQQCGIAMLTDANSNTVLYNIVTDSKLVGISLNGTNNNVVYGNNFINNTAQAYVENSSNNIWNSPEEITYTYNGNTYISYLGNYWSDYVGSDAGGDGIGDIPYTIGSDSDNYPLMEPFTFYGAQYNLTISSTAGGSVTFPGEGTFIYDEARVVNLVATPTPGSRFVNWTGDVGTIANVNAAMTAITMTGNYSITANFASGYTPMVAAGWHHTVGLRADGAAVATGYNDAGQCDVRGWADIVQVAAGGWHTVGLKSDGTAVAVGYDIPGQCNVGDWTDITQAAASILHTVGLKSNGTVVALGNNEQGQCDVGNWTDIIQVAAGNRHTVGLKDDGTVVAAGDNYWGACDVGGWTDITQLAAGLLHTVGVKSDGTVVAVGFNLFGQCNVNDWMDIDKVAAGSYHTVGLESDGTVITAGTIYHGECNVGGWTDIDKVAAGSYHTVGVRSNGTVAFVGEYILGQYNVGGWTDITQAAAGWGHTMGLKNDNTVVAVGHNAEGQCEVSSWTDITQITAGVVHSVGLKDNGTVVAVGSNNLEQCNVGGWTDIDQVAAGAWHTVGLKDDHTVVAVGYDGLGQCNILGWRNIIQVAAGGSHTVGLKDDNTVVAVGRSLEGQCNVNSWTGINQTAAGYWHTVGLKSDGTVVAVGANDQGQCDVDGWTDIIQVAAAGEHTGGLKSDGTVVAVGAEVELPQWNLYETPARRYSLTIFSTPGGAVTEPGEGTHIYDEGEELNLIAEPEEGYRFVCWTGDVGTIANVYAAQTTITMNDDYSITARFTEVVNSKTETVSDGTVDAKTEADTEVAVTGNATVTVAQFADNPGGYCPTGFNALDNYIDVYVPYAGEATEVVVRLYYTDAEVAAAGIDEESLRLFWWDGAEWVQCSYSGVNTTSTNGYSGYIWAIITEDTTPSLDNLQGTPFSGYGHPSTPRGGCFIATAAYDTPMAGEVEVLREFRDEYLLTNPLGQAFVDFYYKTSPPIAEFITEHPSLKPIVKVGLLPAVAVSNVAVKTTAAEKVALAGLLVLVSAALAVWATRRRGRGPEYT
jgi:parallel beta-helix repeat protein